MAIKIGIPFYRALYRRSRHLCPVELMYRPKLVGRATGRDARSLQPAVGWCFLAPARPAPCEPEHSGKARVRPSGQVGAEHRHAPTGGGAGPMSNLDRKPGDSQPPTAVEARTAGVGCGRTQPKRAGIGARVPSRRQPARDGLVAATVAVLRPQSTPCPGEFSHKAVLNPGCSIPSPRKAARLPSVVGNEASRVCERQVPKGIRGKVCITLGDAILHPSFIIAILAFLVRIECETNSQIVDLTDFRHRNL